ncbi:choline dehydrogenase, mitochondrial [Lingula anatina]|uniref:Choline dehydrogenase n=1 Tax=Lingula anatina TaxID=7574 RepID=A0A1S3H832_LINAN|nr:choline dehydrogenase, mitochondrial [Lingula anatina]|eukprot:XP_013382158.1 choline dehydrogenase, mitochondrial [Lingula anatina]
MANLRILQRGRKQISTYLPVSSQGIKLQRQVCNSSCTSITRCWQPVVSQRRHLSVSSPSDVYDYVIVGAGSAGCVLANRLSADPNNRVLVLEAGPEDKWWNWKIHMPAAMPYNLCNDKYNWYYNTVPQKRLNNRVIYWPRGRVWGGSSALNGMVYIRGHAYDYERWEKEGATGWSYADCLPYFRKAQTHDNCAEDEYIGGAGPLHVSRGNRTNPLFKAFIEAGLQAGYPYTSDQNGYQQEGFGPMDMTVHKGKRWSASQGYLRPVLGRPNLTVTARTMTHRVVFEAQKAVGVEYKQNSQVKTVRAAKEVILAGGAINSPQLLMLSGVGDGDDLRELGIPVVQHLPGVGQNLQDHLEIGLQQECTQPITLYTAQWKFPHNMIRIGLQWFLSHSGMGATTHMEVGGFIRSAAGVQHPDIQFHFLPSTFNDHGRKPGDRHAFQAHIGTLRSASTGHIKLKSRDPNDHPLIDANYMSMEQDWEEFRVGLRLTREIFSQKAFDEFRGPELKPGLSVQTDAEIDAFVRATADTVYHPSCTCKMGAADDKMAVVNSSGQVYGLKNLRVVDASIMPSMVSGNLNAPTIMIAEKCADVILGKPPLAPSSAKVWQPSTLETQRTTVGIAT